jgi:hypothetical protein
MTIVRAAEGRLRGMAPGRVPRLARLAVIPVAVMTMAVTGCSASPKSNSSSSGTTNPASPVSTASGSTNALCNDASAVRSSISELRNTPLNDQTVQTLSNKLDTIGNQVDQLKKDARGTLKPQLDQLSASLKVLRTNFEAAIKRPSGANLAAIPSAAESVSTAANNLRKAAPDC